MDLAIVILSEVSQTEKDKYRLISLICGIESQIQKTNLWVSGGKGREGKIGRLELTYTHDYIQYYI